MRRVEAPSEDRRRGSRLHAQLRQRASPGASRSERRCRSRRRTSPRPPPPRRRARRRRRLRPPIGPGREKPARADLLDERLGRSCRRRGRSRRRCPPRRAAPCRRRGRRPDRRTSRCCGARAGAGSRATSGAAARARFAGRRRISSGEPSAGHRERAVPDAPVARVLVRRATPPRARRCPRAHRPPRGKWRASPFARFKRSSAARASAARSPSAGPRRPSLTTPLYPSFSFDGSGGRCPPAFSRRQPMRAPRRPARPLRAASSGLSDGSARPVTLWCLPCVSCRLPRTPNTRRSWIAAKAGETIRARVDPAYAADGRRRRRADRSRAARRRERAQVAVDRVPRPAARHERGAARARLPAGFTKPWEGRDARRRAFRAFGRGAHGRAALRRSGVGRDRAGRRMRRSSSRSSWR